MDFEHAVQITMNFVLLEIFLKIISKFIPVQRYRESFNRTVVLVNKTFLEQ